MCNPPILILLMTTIKCLSEGVARIKQYVRKCCKALQLLMPWYRFTYAMILLAFTIVGIVATFPGMCRA